MAIQKSSTGRNDELLPITGIILYRSGVGAFQREGQIEGSASVALKFDQTQINDILKSLQLLDLDGGRIDSVAYASKDPLGRRLNSFSVPIADNPSLATLLTRLRGANVTLSATEGQLTGNVLGVETRKVPPGTGKDVPPVDTPFVTLVTEKGIQAVNISGITCFQITDKKLADELNKALLAVSDARGDRVKTVDLSFSGKGRRRIAVRYVHETPLWKTSYRLIIGAASAKKETLTLQGWAIVENTTDTDWKEVKLSLVSGRPVSFQMDLSEPMYMYRPEIAVPTIPGAMPKNYEAGVELEAEARLGGAAPAAGGRKLSKRGPIAVAAAAAPGAASAVRFLSGSALERSSPAPQATAGEIGEVFFFEVQNPITIERQRSAMIPFLAEQVAGRRVSIYNLNDRADHPMRGVELTNSSGCQLLPGPISVFDESAYAGDATINQISPGDKRLLAYAVDLDVAVTTKNTEARDLARIKIVNGAFQQTIKRRFAITYSFANKDLKRSRLLIVEQSKLPGWTLSTQKQVDSTQSLYRFELTVGAGQTGELTVCQECTESQQVGFDTQNQDTLVQWHASGALSTAALQTVTELARQRHVIANSERWLTELDKQIETNTKEQARISEIMQRLPQTGELYGDYTRELKELNAALKPLRTNRKDEFDKLEKLRRDLNDHVAHLNIE